MAEAGGGGGGSGGGGGGEKIGKFPTGFRFKPTDEELIEYYLLPRLQGRPSEPNDSIIEANVYECHPETLVYDRYRDRGEDGWFFLSPRARMYQNGVRPARKTEDGRGRWKASTATKVVAKETVGDGVKFCRNVLNYFEGSPKVEQRTRWLMRELTLPDFEIKRDSGGPNHTLDEYVMCKIYVSPVHKTNDDEASTSGAREEAQHSQWTVESKLSERQAGKRPMEEQTRARKHARQGSLTIGSSQASGASNVFAPAGYNGAPGGSMAGPSGMQHGQAPVQRPAGAYNGQVPLQRPTLFPLLPAATNPNSGRMAMRPPNLGFPGPQLRQQPGAGFRPQVSLNCVYDHNYRAVQPPGNAPYGMQQQRPPAFAQPTPQQHPYFNGNLNNHAGAFVPQWPPYNNCYPYQCSSMPQAEAGDHGGAAAALGAAMRFNAEHHFVELAAMNTSLDGRRAQTGPVPIVESVTPIRAPKLETEVEATSNFHKEDAA